MELTILELDANHLPEVNRCDSAFTVDSKLILNAENSRFTYRIEGVSLYQKRYLVDEIEPTTYIESPEKVIYLAYLDSWLALTPACLTPSIRTLRRSPYTGI